MPETHRDLERFIKESHLAKVFDMHFGANIEDAYGQNQTEFTQTSMWQSVVDLTASLFCSELLIEHHKESMMKYTRC